VAYNKEYFVKDAPSTLLEMLQRVPGVQAILDANRRVGVMCENGPSFCKANSNFEA
jgi:hypothetical protein